MSEFSESVCEITDYLDRPLKGVAKYRGILHRFCCVGWVSPPPEVAATWETLQPWFLEHWDPDEDRYQLIPVDGGTESSVWMRARFQGAEPGFEIPVAGLESLRVDWSPISIRERLDRILETGRWGGPEGCTLDTPAYLCVRFWLNDEDLETIRPDFTRDADYPNLGEVGRYRSIPVFPLSDRVAEMLPAACYQSVWFWYVPCLCVD